MRNFTSGNSFLPLILIVQALFFVGCDQSKSNQTGGSKPAGTPIEAMVIQPQVLHNRIFTTGTLLANEEVELRPEIGGRVTEVHFEEGSKVAKGTLMLKINDSELKANQKRKQIEEKLASDEEQRRKGLLNINGISKEEYERSLNALEVIKAEREIIESQLAKTAIYAPFDGVVGLRQVSEGSYVNSNSLVATMQQIDPMKVEFAVPEKYAGMIKNGLNVMISVGDFPSPLNGTIFAVESKIELSTRTIKARARIANPKQSLIPGSFAKVEINLETISDAIVIPSGAIIPELEGEKVFLYEGGKAKAVPVKTGIRTETGIQIVDGVESQDTLILTGLLQISNGSDVSIKEIKQ
ncbi:MAG TPA: efflux RND transporter periplasmic adaptor subunit [candidate division Zixibacteria bacterium]|nr:efflux RND transporter periplasmic adaptor subunit [candidate division Zixibacteria bacterium]